ncbi:MAG: hypothetical protein GC150_13030 [Rhizobiales bacterium]|nr:hypothetical protein [Hyphomicrobiales bacterium]
MPIPTRVGRICRLALALVLPIGLSACFDIEQRITLEPDGLTRVATEVHFSPQFNDILAALEVRGRHFDTGLDLDRGLCEIANEGASSSLPPGVAFTASQLRTPDGLICRFELTFREGQYLQMAAALSGEAFIVEDLPGGTTRIGFDLSRVPDPTPLLTEALLDQMRTRLGLSAPRLDPADIAEILDADRRALAGLAELIFRDHRLTFIVTAPRIIETSGAISDDGQSTSHSMRFVDMVRDVLDPDTEARPSFRALVGR